LFLLLSSATRRRRLLLSISVGECGRGQHPAGHPLIEALLKALEELKRLFVENVS
jgi:hypothetical protein